MAQKNPLPPTPLPQAGVFDGSPILTACCEDELPALIISPVLATLAHGHFDKTLDDAVRFTVVEEVPFRKLTLCCVSFSFNNRAHLFMSNVRDYVHSEEGAWVTFEMPAHVTVAELRSTFRIPMAPDSGLPVHVDAHGNVTTPAVVDISLNGICVEFEDRAEMPNVNETVQVTIDPSGAAIRLRGNVRNKRDRKCGIFFPEVMRGSHIEPPEDLRTLVRKLEMDYIRNQKELVVN